MATVLEQVLNRLDVILKANVPAGCSVFRDRTDAQSLAEAPSVNVLAQEGAAEPMSEMDRHEVFIDLVIYTRGDQGAMACEAVHRAVHGPVVTDAALAALAESRRLVDHSFDRQEADGTSTHKRVRYRFTYLIPFNTL